MSGFFFFHPLFSKTEPKKKKRTKMAALRHLILLAVMAAAFHHSRPASAKSVPDVGERGKNSVQSARELPTTPPTTSNALPTKGAAAARTKPDAVIRPSLPPHSATPPHHPQRGGGKALQQRSSDADVRDTRANVRIVRGNDDAAATASTWAGSDGQQVQPSHVPLPESSSLARSKGAAAAGASRRGSTTTDFMNFGFRNNPSLSLSPAHPPPPHPCSTKTAPGRRCRKRRCCGYHRRHCRPRHQRPVRPASFRCDAVGVAARSGSSCRGWWCRWTRR